MTVNYKMPEPSCISFADELNQKPKSMVLANVKSP